MANYMYQVWHGHQKCPRFGLQILGIIHMDVTHLRSTHDGDIQGRIVGCNKTDTFVLRISAKILVEVLNDVLKGGPVFDCGDAGGPGTRGQEEEESKDGREDQVLKQKIQMENNE